MNAEGKHYCNTGDKSTRAAVVVSPRRVVGGGLAIGLSVALGPAVLAGPDVAVDYGPSLGSAEQIERLKDQVEPILAAVSAASSTEESDTPGVGDNAVPIQRSSATESAKAMRAATSIASDDDDVSSERSQTGADDGDVSSAASKIRVDDDGSVFSEVDRSARR